MRCVFDFEIYFQELSSSQKFKSWLYGWTTE